jgi:tetratricopeptide (TPR) repeat protein
VRRLRRALRSFPRLETGLPALNRAETMAGMRGHDLPCDPPRAGLSPCYTASRSCIIATLRAQHRVADGSGMLGDHPMAPFSHPRADVPFESDTAPVGFKGPTAGQPRGWVHYNRGAYDEAEPIIRKAAELANRSAPIQYHLGMTYYRLGKKDEAVLALRRALQVDPKFPEAARAREVLSMLGQ